jgi:DNA-directed RNA polymerase specialized sigma24 family protein
MENNLVKEMLIKYNPIKTFMGFAITLTSNEDEAKELIAHCSLKAIEKSHLFVTNTNFKGWFMQILKNEFINRSRLKKKNLNLLYLKDIEDNITNNGMNDELKEVFKNIQNCPKNCEQL